MENLIDFVLNGATDFTPRALIGIFIFTLILESISSVCCTVIKVGNK